MAGTGTEADLLFLKKPMLDGFLGCSSLVKGGVEHYLITIGASQSQTLSESIEQRAVPMVVNL